MAATVSYKGSTIATISNQTKTLTTSGKYMEADVVITDTPETKDWVILVSNNLHDSSTDVANYYINRSGVLESYSGWSATDYISVNPNTWYRILSGPGNNWNAFYDSSKNPITNYMAVYIGTEDNERSVSLLKSPPNAYYLRISETTSKVTKVDIREADFNMPIGNVSITSNGTVNVSQYETATVNINPLVYYLPSPVTFAGTSSSQVVDTNIAPMSSASNSFTICVDYTPDSPDQEAAVFNNGSFNNSVLVRRNSGTQIQYAGVSSTVSGSTINQLTERVKVVITHEGDTYIANAYVNTASLSSTLTYTLTNPGGSVEGRRVSSNNLFLGGFYDGTKLWKGTIHDFQIWNKVLSTYEINKYLSFSSDGGSSGMNVQAYTGYASRTANSYGATSVTLTVAKTGTYNISWCAWRSSSSGTMGTNLHIGSTTGTNQQTWTGTYGQCITLTNQSLTQGTVLTLYATSGSNSRTIYVGNLVIEQTA